MSTPDARIASADASPVALPTSERLLRAVTSAARDADAPTGELRDALRAHVGELKACGYPPERVLIAVKMVTAQAGVRRRGPLADVGQPFADPDTALADRVVTWCVEEYFRE